MYRLETAGRGTREPECDYCAQPDAYFAGRRRHGFAVVLHEAYGICGVGGDHAIRVHHDQRGILATHSPEIFETGRCGAGRGNPAPDYPRGDEADRSDRAVPGDRELVGYPGGDWAGIVRKFYDGAAERAAHPKEAVRITAGIGGAGLPNRDRYSEGTGGQAGSVHRVVWRDHEF